MQQSRYCWTIIVETVFSMWFVPKCYKQGQSSSGGSCQQLPERRDVKQLVCERKFSCQLSVVSQPVRKRLGDWREMAARLGPS
jgi:hypothetical protein